MKHVKNSNLKSATARVSGTEARKALVRAIHELSNDELENVAGGATPPPTVVT